MDWGGLIGGIGSAIASIGGMVTNAVNAGNNTQTVASAPPPAQYNAPTQTGGGMGGDMAPLLLLGGLFLLLGRK